MINIINISITTIKEIIQDPKLTIAVAFISGLFVLLSKFIDWLISSVRLNREKQSYYFNKTCILVENGVEVFLRIIFNKLLIAYKITPVETWKNNIFLLHKDILNIESLLVIYAPQEIIEPFADFRAFILSLKDELAAEKWNEIYSKGSNYLGKIRKSLGITLGKNFKDFMEDLKSGAPKEEIKNLDVNVLKKRLESDSKQN
jgi:hypothetical protein